MLQQISVVDIYINNSCLHGIDTFIYFDNEELVSVTTKKGPEVEKFMKTGKFDPALPVLTVINYKKHEIFSLKFPSGFRETSQIWYIQVRIGTFF